MNKARRTTEIGFVLHWLVLLATMLASSTVVAQARPAVHVEIILDSSGSMTDNDPKRLSSLGAMIFTDLAQPDDRLGIQSMKQPRYTLRGLDVVKDNRGQAKSAARDVKFSGSTDCAGPLKKAASELAATRSPDVQQFIIFLSDGACPAAGGQRMEAAARELGANGVRVFSIGLFSDEANQDGAQDRDLRNMATATDGEYFRAKRAGDLPARFAGILGRILGSEAVQIEITPGKASKVSLDGYVHDASLIVTGPRPVRVTRATGPDGKTLAVPSAKAPYATDGANFYASANSNTAGQHYTVLRINAPESGDWDFIVDAPSSASALLIQNYALEPKLSLEGADVVTVGDQAQIRCVLEGSDQTAMKDPVFLEKVGVELEIVAPDGQRSKATMERQNFRFVLPHDITQTGRYQFRARAFMKKGGLNKRTAPINVTAIDFDLAFSGEDTIDLGTVKAGSTTDPFALSMGHSRLARDTDVEISTDISNVAATPGSATLRLDKPEISVQFVLDSDHPGGPLKGQLIVSSGGDSAAIPVVGQVTPITFWERWGELIMLVGGGLLGLLLLIFIFYGFMSPHGFPEDARVSVGNSIDRLEKNLVVIRELRSTGRGFYRNAQLEIGGPTSEIPVSGTRLVTLEATGSMTVSITAEDGVELMRVNKFDHAKEKPVESGSTGMSSGEIFRAGDIYLRLS